MTVSWLSDSMWYQGKSKYAIFHMQYKAQMVVWCCKADGETNKCWSLLILALFPVC